MTANALPFTESLSLDAHLVDWYEALPTYFHQLVNTSRLPKLDSATKRFVQPLSTIKWRYLNLRMLLYRPSLMEAVLRRIPFSGLTSDQQLCIRKCLTLAGETVDSIRTRASEPPNQFIAWPSTWYLLQISMIPLLSLYVFREDVGDSNFQSVPVQQTPFKYSGNAKEQVRQIRDECHRQVQITLRLMKEMEPWAVASGKMHDLIRHLYEARDQHLRVWNNTDDSPVLVLGSPENTSSRQTDPGPSTKATTSKPTITKAAAPASAAQAYYDPAGLPNLPVNAVVHTHFDGAQPSTSNLNQFEQFSRDWNMYNNFAWPNATLESLFDLPDEFQYMGQDPFDIG
jgi:hypothetical protein